MECINRSIFRGIVNVVAERMSPGPPPVFACHEISLGYRGGEKTEREEMRVCTLEWAPVGKHALRSRHVCTNT